MKLKQKTETRVSENTMSKSDVSKKNTSLSLFGATIITTFLALLVAHCPSSSSNTTTNPPTTGSFAFVCENGTPTAGMTAPTTTTNSCGSCDSGYSLSAGVDSDCVASAPGTFAFVCENGTPTAGMTAPTATTNSCGSCDSGYSLSGDVGSNCVASAPGTFAFVCSNGMPTDGMTAPTATTNSCKGCDSGFMLSGGAGSNCVASAPTFAFVCSNGMPTDGMTAPTATTNSCKGCDSGYSLSAGVDSSCIANRATTSDLLITQFQGGKFDTTAVPMTEFRQAMSDSYSTSVRACRRFSGNTTSDCRSYLVEIYNGTNSAVTLSNYALIASSNGATWGAASGSELHCDKISSGGTIVAGPTSLQVRFDGNIESPAYDITNSYCRRLILADSLNSNSELASDSFHVVSRPEWNGNNFIPNQLWSLLTYGGDDGVALARLASSYTPSNCPTSTQSVSFTPASGSAETWCLIDKFGEDYTNNPNYVDPGDSWRVTSSSTDNSSANTFLRKRSVIAPTTDWDISRGCTANCNTVSPTIDATTQWIEVSGYVYTNVGTDTLAN